MYVYKLVVGVDLINELLQTSGGGGGGTACMEGYLNLTKNWHK